MRVIRYHDEARLELVHEVGYYTAINAGLGERFDKAIQSAAKRAGWSSSPATESSSNNGGVA